MLRQRVITALLLLAVLLPALLVPKVWPFALLSIGVVAAAGWEWGRLNGAGEAGSVLLGTVVGGLCAATWGLELSLLEQPWLWWAATAAWVLGGALVLRRGPPWWPAVPVALRLGLGVVMLWLTWVALTRAKASGVAYLLSVFCLVWAADIAAYFGGRAFGRRKLAPAISPGKSWEGVWSGMVGVLVLAVAWVLVDRAGTLGSPSIYTGLQARFGWVGLLVVCVFLAAMSVVGDLFESLVKRSVGAKDSSQLLPGHGGVLDRIDALLPVFPIALTLSLL
ncbi:phosphatidate cytidylyltransferase [Aquabacterium sp. A7-Y]|uniref:phosphatidate cytidylyltransferase n=1 Tax=Aquabacterium sp. A7-Y TaxID=1349605 RepID=UPI00223D9B32|nr:phosphatidate cytidylyltransferase [Aquabacterium sp. A7-Y]MCW7540318.1 phosphatidate cytidylyltransferase [Aquabacterium sp. A7-Y]